jgi:multicomponent Na+:H+ antiporter subunit A
VRMESRLATIALLGSIGFSIALLFLLYSAPDLAMVQFAIETLTVILFVLVIYRLPKFAQLSSRRTKTIDSLVSVLGGLMMTLLMLITSAHPGPSLLAPFFLENSMSQAYGRNVVNVILVDFRGLDTLGEITVLAIAAIGVSALLRLVRRSANTAPREVVNGRK